MLYQNKNSSDSLLTNASLAVYRYRRSLPFALLAIALAAASCGSDPAASGSSNGDGGEGGISSSGDTGGLGTGGNGTGGGSGGSDVECETTKNAGDPYEVMLTSVEGTVVDTTSSAAPVPNNIVQFCGINLCLNAKTGQDGHFKVEAGGQVMTRPALKYGDGLLYGKFAVLIDEAVTNLQTLATPKLPDTGAKLVAGQIVKSGEVELTIEAGAGIEIDKITYDSEDKQAFRSAIVQLDKPLPAVDPTLGLKMIYAVSPVDTFICPPAKVTVPNTGNWAPGTTVEFFVHGVSIFEEYVPYGGWAKVTDGVVSDNGETITTVDGGGLPILTVFGVRGPQ